MYTGNADDFSRWSSKSVAQVNPKQAVLLKMDFFRDVSIGCIKIGSFYEVLDDRFN